MPKDSAAQACVRSGQPLRSFVGVAWSWCGALPAVSGWLDAVIDARGYWQMSGVESRTK
jgi:hypothetical protein